MSYICYLLCGSFHWPGHLSNKTTLIRVSLLSFTVQGILTKKATVRRYLTCAGKLRGTFSWTVYSCKRKVARQSGICVELLSVMCVRLCLVSKGCGCMHQLEGWFKHIQYGLSCRRMNLLRMEVFVKLNVIGQQYMSRHRQIKLCCGSKRISNSHALQYSQWCTKFLASLEMFYLFPIWLIAENMVMHVFSD